MARRLLKRGTPRAEAEVVSKQRYVLLFFFLFAGSIGLSVQAAVVSGFAQFAYPDNRVMGFITTSSAAALLSGAVTFVVLIRNRRALAFTAEVVGELLRVTWPSREETVRASTTVLLTAAFTAVILALFDFTWKNLADLLLYTE